MEAGTAREENTSDPVTNLQMVTSEQWVFSSVKTRALPWPAPAPLLFQGPACLCHPHVLGAIPGQLGFTLASAKHS